MNGIVGQFCAGAGFAATGPMTALMEAAGRLLPAHEQEPLPPRRITERAAEKVGLDDELTEEQKAAAAMANHFAYGTGGGAASALLAPYVPLARAARGVGFALGLWAVSYFGLLPAAGLYRPPHRDSAARNALM